MKSVAMESEYQNTLLYDAILRDIYGSASMNSHGGDYLQAINGLLSADSTILVIADRHTNEIIEARGAGITQHSIESPASPYTQYLWSLDPLLQAQGNASAFQARDFHNNRSYRRFFRECLRPFNLAPFISINIKMDQRRNLCLRLARLEGQRDFDHAELSMAKNLARHLSGAQRERSLPRHSHEFGSALSSMAKHLRTGVFILDEHCQLMFANSRARQHLATVSIDRVRKQLSSRLAAHHSGQIMASTGPTLSKAVGSLLLFSITSARHPTMHFAASLPQDPSDSWHGEPSRHTLILSSCEGERGVEPAILEHLFPLTPSESAIAARLAEGMNIDEVATALCRSRNTVRAHSRSIYRKLGISNQAQLTQKILSSIAGTVTGSQ